jgi:Lsr2
MAKTSAIVLTCDLPPDDHAIEGLVVTVEFGYKGKTYEVELCPAHLLEYDNWMSDYVTQGAREVSGGRSRRSSGEAAPVRRRGRPPKAAGAAKKRSGGRRTAGAVDTRAVRAWAQANGYEVGDRGRMPSSVVEAYKAAELTPAEY